MLVMQRPTVEAIGEATNNQQRFSIGPLEPGFGHTLGNSLRRTLLSSIPGAAITTVRFDDAADPAGSDGMEEAASLGEDVGLNVGILPGPLLGCDVMTEACRELADELDALDEHIAIADILKPAVLDPEWLVRTGPVQRYASPRVRLHREDHGGRVKQSLGPFHPRQDEDVLFPRPKALLRPEEGMLGFEGRRLGQESLRRTPAEPDADIVFFAAGGLWAGASRELAALETLTFPQVRATHGLGARPLAVLSAATSDDPDLAIMQAELAALSSESTYAVVAGADHASIIMERRPARTVAEHILRVVAAARASSTYPQVHAAAPPG